MQQILTILGSVGFNWHVALANFVNFLIILFLLNRFFFKKIGKTIDTRHKIIEEGLNQARSAEKALATAEEEKNIIIKSAHKQYDVIVANGEALARDLAASIKLAAEESIDARNRKLDEEEKNLEAKTLKAFNEKAPELVAKLFAKTLMNEMTDKENNELIARMHA